MGRLAAFLLALGVGALGLSITSPVDAATYWVSPTGTSIASGADSLSNAKSLAWVNSNATSGDVIRFKSGSYGTAIYPIAHVNSSRIRFYGFPQDPTAVVVPSITFDAHDTTGGCGDSRNGSYITVRWVTSSGAISFPTCIKGVPIRDSIVACRTQGIFDASTGLGTVLVDSLVQDVTMNGSSRDAVAITGNGLHFDPTTSCADDSIKNSIFNITVNSTPSVGFHALFTGSALLRPVFLNDRWNVTNNNALGYWYGIEQYWTYGLVMKGNTWSINLVGTTGTGSNGVFTARDSSRNYQFIENVFRVFGSGSASNPLDFQVTNSGHATESTGWGLFSGNIFDSDQATASNAMFQIQDGLRYDTWQFNTFISHSASAAPVVWSGYQNRGLTWRHNTHVANSNTILDFHGASVDSGCKFVGNVCYSTSANSSTKPTVWMTSSAQDSGGTYFSRGGTPGFALGFGGSGSPSSVGAPGSGGSFGVSGKAVWGSPVFVDSSFSTLNVSPHSYGYAHGAKVPSLQDGFAGVYSDSLGSQAGSGSLPAPDVRIDVRHTADGVVGSNNTLVVVLRNIGSGATTGHVTGSVTYGTGITYSSNSSGAGWTNSNAGASFSYDYATAIPPGDSASFTLTVAVASGAAPSTTNTGTISAGSSGYNAGASSDADVLPVTFPPAPDVRIDVRHTVDGVVGTNNTLKVVIRNVGTAATASDVSGNVAYGTGIGYVSDVSVGNWSNFDDGGDFSFDYGDPIDAADSVSFTLTVSVAAPAVPGTTNTGVIDNTSSGYNAGFASDADFLPVITLSSVNVTTGYSIQVEPTLYSCGVRIFLQGDADTNAVCRLFYRRAGTGAAFDSSMMMIRRVKTTTHVGRMIDLLPATSYEYYVEISDVDGGSVNSGVASVTTRAVPGLAATAAAIYCSKAGNDANDGLGPGSSHAKKTIAGARAALTLRTNGGAGGGVVLVGPGEWHERFDGNFGSPSSSAQFFLIGDGAYPDSTIIDGSYEPAAVNGFVDATHALSWTATGVDSIYKAYYPHGDSCSVVVLGFGERLHHKLSMTELIQDAMGERSGWWWQNDTLYVQRATGGSPSGLALHAGYIDNLVWLQKRCWRIANLTFRYAGGVGQQGYAIRVGGGPSFPANLFSAESLSVYGTGKECIIGTQGSDSCVVRNCRFSGLTVSSMPYQAAKTREEENTVGISFEGKAWTVADNTIFQTFNGITGLANNAADTSSTADCEVVRNWIHDTQDDALEIELAHCINTLVIDNTTERTRSMISMAPIWSGPEWVLFNSSNNCIEGAFKLGDGSAVNGSVGYALISNNTCTCSGGSPSGVNSVGLYQNKHFRNNVLVGCDNFAIRNLDKGDLTLYGVADTVGSYTNDFNYDVIDSVGTISQVASWLKVSGVIRGYSLASLRSNAIGFKWETNGQQGGVTYADSSRAQLWMRSRSRTVNAGCRIPGVNTMPSRQRGTAPDVGRWEYPFKSIEDK